MPDEPTVRCYRCGLERPADTFIRTVNDRHYRMCRECVSEVLKRREPRKARLHHSDTERICYLCRRKMANANFTRRSNGTYFSACKDCNRHVFQQRRRARLLSAQGEYSYEEWCRVLERYDACPRCGRRWNDIPQLPGRRSVITADHVVPLARGGSNDISNIQPLCYSCNSAKGDRA